jgi:phosphatidylglycerol:prolipoprotein diacylglycerol transferase
VIVFFPSRTVFVEIGTFAVHWYGIMYLCAFLLALFLLPRLQRYRSTVAIEKDQWSELLTLGVLGVLAGGRLGFVFFYEPLYFLQHPLDVFAVWKGGMSSHGGLIGVVFGVWLFCRKHRVPVLALADLIVVPAALGLALGRIGNFINLELYGSVTTLPWGIAIPGVEGLRHPTQLYAVAKDLAIAGICFSALSRSSIAGFPTGMFFISYGVLRFLLEYLRVPSHETVNLAGVVVTRGQLLTIPLVVVGLLLVWAVAKRHRRV